MLLSTSTYWNDFKPMKQTNSAIKFLMAQYRAIFKNANLKMFLAATTAAVALSSGAAQAATGTGDNPTPSFTEELKDSVLNKGEDLKHSTTDHIILNAPAGQPIVINGGSLTNYDGSTIGGGHIFDKNDIILNSGSISLHKHATNDTGLLGKGSESSAFTGSLFVNGGTLENNGSFIWMREVKLAGGTTTVGGNYTNKPPVTTSGNQVQNPDFTRYSMIYSTGAPLTITGNAVVNMDPASGMFGKNVNIDGGTINFKGTNKVLTTNKGASSGAFIRTSVLGREDTLSINGGTVNVKTGKFGGLYGDNIVMNGGTVNVEDSGELTLGGNLYIPAKGANVSLNAGTLNVGKGSTLVLEGDVKLADGVLKNKGTVAFSAIPEGQERSLTLSANEFNNSFFKDAGAKLTASGTAQGATEEFELNITGGNADLVGSKFLTDTGDLNSTVVFEDTVKGSLVTDNATISADSYSGNAVLNIGNLTAGKSGAFTIKSGSSVEIRNSLTVTPKDNTADLTVKGSLSLIGNGGSVNANKVTVDSEASGTPGTFNVDNGTWNVKSLTITSGSATVTGENTRLNLTGTLTTTQTNGVMNVQDGAIVDASNGVLKLAAGGVDLKTGSTLVLDAADVFTNTSGTIALTSGTEANQSNFAAESVKTDATSILKLKTSGDLTVAQIKKIREAVAGASPTNFHGFLNVAGANITDRPTGDVDLSATTFAEGIEGLYNNVAVNVGQGGAVAKSFTAAQLKLTDASDNKANLASGTSVMLTGSKGDFVVNKEGKAADVSLASGASLVLAGNGSIGAITGAGADSGSVVIGHHSLGHGTVNAESIGGTDGIKSLDLIDSALNVAGAVKSSSLDLDGHSSLIITADAGSGSITVDSLTVGDDASINATGQAVALGSANNESSSILGDVTAKSVALTGSGTISVAGNATVSVESLDFGSGKLVVGDDAADVNGSATVITKNLLGSGTLFVDPAYGQKAALVIAESLDAPSDPQNNDAGTLSGTAIVGNNAALGIGFSSEAELHGVIGQYLDSNGSFTRMPRGNQIANALVLNKKIKLDTNKGIVIKKDATLADAPTTSKLDIDLGSALIITDKVFDVGADGTKSGVAITFNTSGTINAGNGDIILYGSFDEKDTSIQIFNSTAGLADAVSVSTSNGLLTGSLAKGSTTGTVTNLQLQEEKAKALFAGVSAPAQELLIDTLKGKYKTKKGVGTDFVYTVANTSMNAVELDAVLHAATYAGAQQAAVAAVGTMAEAVAGRVGSTGVETTVLAATGAEGHGGVWVTPMYKSVNSDGFNAQGASYGSDVDLAGVTFGVDSVRGNMRFGAAFNIGSGDADGKGNGNGLKDEFDYYGFGIYTAMNFNHCNLIADASVNVISHDVEGYSGHQEFGTLAASADTTAVTLGLTGQYTHATEFVDVIPHVGMRFTRLDTDSYDLNSAKGVLANTDFDVQNVFSIPVGVTLSKTFEHNGWVYAPAADFTLTFNTGDTEVDSTTHMNDMTNVALNTEVLDEVTYGLNFGFSAQSGSFGTSVNVSYAGSENSDSVGINANARYMF